MFNFRSCEYDSYLTTLSVVHQTGFGRNDFSTADDSLGSDELNLDLDEIPALME